MLNKNDLIIRALEGHVVKSKGSAMEGINFIIESAPNLPQLVNQLKEMGSIADIVPKPIDNGFTLPLDNPLEVMAILAIGSAALIHIGAMFKGTDIQEAQVSPLVNEYHPIPDALVGG